MRAFDFDECECLCHIDDHIMHCFPCCTQCPYCSKRLKFCHDQHIAECKRKEEELLEQMKQQLSDE